MEQPTSLQSQTTTIRNRIQAAADRAGRKVETITLIAVTKTKPVELIRAAMDAGLTHFGENRVQEALPKIDALATKRPRPHWHLIGHLQRNKARRAVQAFDLLHSLDSVRLAKTLDRQVGELRATGERDTPFPVLLQLNISGELSKEGWQLLGGVDNQLAWDALVADVAQIAVLPHLRVQGLMTVAPYGDDPETVRPVFRQLRCIRDALAVQFPQLEWTQLSMGMTNDFEVAIEEGATFVRIGRALLGERPPPTTSD